VWIETRCHFEGRGAVVANAYFKVECLKEIAKDVSYVDFIVDD